MASWTMDLDEQTCRGDKRRSEQQESGSNKQLRRADAAVELPMFALDVSGSTGGQDSYWTVAAHVLATQNGAANVQPVLWDDTVRGTTQADLEEAIATREGHGGTRPSAVVHEILSRNFHGRLLLITDGEISQDEVDTCDRLLPLDWGFSDVDVYVINSTPEDRQSVNVSVGCPFMRCAPTRVFVADAALQLNLVHVVTNADRSLLDTISEVSEFNAHFERIKAVVEACTRGLLNHAAMRQKLLALQRRLVTSTAYVSGDELYQLLGQGKTSAAEDAARRMIETNSNDSLDDRMHSLLRMTQGALRHDFTISGIRTAAAQYALLQHGEFEDHACGIAAATLDRAPLSEPFTCPITLDDDVSQALMVYDTTAFWEALSTEQQRQVFACPLVLLAPFMKPQLAALVAQLGHVISVGAFRDLCSHSAAPLSPFTRRQIARAAICAGPSDEEMAATDVAIRHAFTAGRLLGNVEMWFIVLWYAVQEVPHLVATPGFIDNMRAQLAKRLEKRTVAASLTGLDGTVNARLSLGAAIWFVAGTAHVHNEVVPGQEAIRLHLAYSTVLEKLCDMQGFAISEQARAHVNRLKALSALYTACKFVSNQADGTRRNATPAEQQAFFAKLKRLYQASRGQVLLDGPASPHVTARSLGLPAGCWHVPPSDLLQLSRMVDPQSKFGHTKLPATWNPEPVPAAVTTWDYAYVSAPVPICPATARPWSASWQAAAQTKFAVDSSKKLLPMHHWLMEYARKLNRFPTADELVLWIAGKYPTLHTHAYDMAEDAIRDYQPLVATLPFADLMARYRASRSKEARARLESLPVPAAEAPAAAAEAAVAVSGA